MIRSFLKLFVFALLVSGANVFCDDAAEQFKPDELQVDYCLQAARVGYWALKVREEGQFSNALNNGELANYQKRLNEECSNQAELEKRIVERGGKVPSCDECKEVLRLLEQKSAEMIEVEKLLKMQHSQKN